jgi:hypothetical protein
MPQALTTNKLINSVKLRAFIPENQNTFREQDFLTLINEEIMMGMVPMILRQHEDYLLVSEIIPLEDGVSEYSIPSRAVGNKLREITYQDTQGNVYEMTRIEIQDLPYYQGPYSTSNNVYAFYITNNKVVLAPGIKGSVTGNLVMSFFMRPNAMVAESRAAIVTNINALTGEVTVDDIPVDSVNQIIFNTLTPLDFIEADGPHITLNYDVLPTGINNVTNVITFNPSDLPSDLQVGDYINLAGECIVPQIPTDLHMQLAARVALRCSESMGDAQAVQIAQERLTELSFNAGSIIDNRVEGSQKKIVNRNATVRNGLFNRRWRFGGR